MLQTSKRIDRRELIAGSAAGAAALAIAAVPAVAGASDLAQVIEAHRVAFQRYRTRLGELTEIEDALSDARRKNPAMVPISILPNGESRSGCYELGAISAEEIRKDIKRTHDQLRELHCSKWSRMMLPDFAAAMEGALLASQERAVRALEQAEASIAERERDAGLPEAQAAVRETQQVELDARVRLTLAVPANAEEARAKAQYIKDSPPFRDGWCSEEDFVRAMIDRLGEHRA